MDNVSIKIILLSVLIHIASGCLPTGGRNEVVRGDSTYVCLTLNDQYLNVLSPTADDFFRFKIPGSYAAAKACNSPFDGNNSTTPGCESTLSIESMGIPSLYKKRYVNADGSRFFPLLTAVISVLDGEVKSIAWDDGCWFCEPDDTNELQSCVPNAILDGKSVAAKNPGLGWECGLTSKKCEENEGVCDLEIHVVWSGTDKTGKYFRSAGSRLQRFSMYALPDMSSFLTDSWNEVQNIVT